MNIHDLKMKPKIAGRLGGRLSWRMDKIPPKMESALLWTAIVVAMVAIFIVGTCRDLNTSDRIVGPRDTVTVVDYAPEIVAHNLNVESGLMRAIFYHAHKEQIPVLIAVALVRVESNFNPRAVSYAGAIGLTQVMPSTARTVIPGVTRKQLMHPDTNLMIGFRYLRKLYDHYGNWHEALSAYNHGMSRFDGYKVASTRYSRYVLGE